MRANSSAAHRVVQTIRSYRRAVSAFSRSAIRRPSGPGKPQAVSRPVSDSCETITDGTQFSRAQSPVQRSVARSDTSSRSGASVVSNRASRRRAVSSR